MYKRTGNIRRINTKRRYYVRRDDKEERRKIMTINHNHCENSHSGDQCNCICHEPYRLIIHDHACCEVCSCGFKTPCQCRMCISNKKSMGLSCSYESIK